MIKKRTNERRWRGYELYGILKICINFTKQGLLSFLERIFFKFCVKKNIRKQDLDTKKKINDREKNQ